MKDVLLYINEKYRVNNSLKQMGVITYKLNYSYSKACPKFSKSPEDAEEQLKKNLKTHNVTKNNIIALFDEESFQNKPYSQKST